MCAWKWDRDRWSWDLGEKPRGEHRAQTNKQACGFHFGFYLS